MSASAPWMAMLLGQIPTLLVYIGGVIFAVLRWQRNPRPAMLTFIGCLLLLSTALLQPLVQTWAFNARSSGGMTTTQVGQILTIVGLGTNLIRAVATGLLIAAAFVHRTETFPEQPAFPMAARAGAQPPPLRG